MIAINDVLVSDDVVQKAFVCDLSSCKGACCWKGDYGAPVTPSEEQEITQALPKIQEFLSDNSIQLLEKVGPFANYNNGEFRGTSLHKSGACVFMTTDAAGIASCAIQEAHHAGAITSQKPISCHLYPIRVTTNIEAGFEAWNYDKWDICAAACHLGKKEQIPIYQFVKSAIVRLKGQAFYDELDAAAKYIHEQDQ